VALFDVLRECTCHPTAEELYRMVRERTSGLSRATVYNTLEALCKAGLARQLSGTNGCCRYDANIGEHLHVQLDDDEICDVPRDLGDRLMHNLPKDVISEIEQRLGVHIDGVSVQLVGRKRSD
jgi:Fur family peroxide stress response transcriptional regulator